MNRTSMPYTLDSKNCPKFGKTSLEKCHLSHIKTKYKKHHNAVTVFLSLLTRKMKPAGEKERKADKINCMYNFHYSGDTELQFVNENEKDK